MFREHAKFYNRLQFAADILFSCAAFPIALWLRTHVVRILPSDLNHLLNPSLLPFQQYFWIIGLAVGSWVVFAYFLGLYRISIRRFGWKKIRIILESSVILWLFVGFISFVLKLDLSRLLIAFFIICQSAILIGIRILTHLRLKRKNQAVSLKHFRNIIIIGTSEKARNMGALISNYSEWGLRILGYIRPDSESETHAGSDVLGSVSDLYNIIENNIVDEIIFAGNRPDLDTLDTILEICKEQGIRFRVAADFFPAKVTKVSMEFIENVPLITFSSAPEHVPSLMVKRLLDIIVSLVMLLISVPFLLIVGAMVRLTSGGPAIYRQVRCGLYGRKFVLFKFRSMREGAEDALWEIKHLNEMAGPVFKMRNDPRVTPLGRFLRKSSIDEWPQFWNVLKGDMSLVGPRAPLPNEVKEYTRWQRRRLSVKPGITCLWQISGRNEIDFHEWMKLDLHYIDNWSLLLDLKILLRTFPVVLFGKGAR
jgi:exopolysaccharide biosynthesis polyprenyl glycosylphosphotransferase